MRVIPETPGWLTPSFHQQFRELMLHASARQKLFCPTYCLMPDHLHLVWMGMSAESDQMRAMKFLRTYLNHLLTRDVAADVSLPVTKPCANRGSWKLQRQAYDHVLKESERKQNAFAKVCFYVLANPVRAELVPNEREWPFGAPFCSCKGRLLGLILEALLEAPARARKLAADSRLELQQICRSSGRESAADF